MGALLGIVVAPLVFLTSLSAAYALVPWMCAKQSTAWLHAVPAIGLLLVTIGLLTAWRDWRALASETDTRVLRRRFLAGVSLGEGGLFAVALIVQWAVLAGLSPCVY
jgi:hypothetical protein